MDNQFVLLHNQDKDNTPIWVNLSLVMTVVADGTGSTIKLLGAQSFINAVEPPDKIVGLAKR